MHQALLVDALRSPIGNLGGALSSVRPDDLAALLIRTIVEKNNLDPVLIEEVYLGCANQAGEDNRNIARMAALLAGLPVSVPGVTFNRLCASGLTAINAAARSIQVGDGDVFIAGGVESMSRAPYALPKPSELTGDLIAYDTTLGWRFVNPRMAEKYSTEPLGITAENIPRPFCPGKPPARYRRYRFEKILPGDPANIHSPTKGRIDIIRHR